MNSKFLFLVLGIIFLTHSSYGQSVEYKINDIFVPTLMGTVKSYTECIMTPENDTLRKVRTSYSENGIRIGVETQSTHTEMGFKNSSVCYKKDGKYIYSTDCKTDSTTDTKMVIGEKGLIIEIDIEQEAQTINYIPYYDSLRRLTTIHTALTKDGTFQIFASLIYTYNEKGLIIKSSAKGGYQPQGITIYTYNKANLLIKTEITEPTTGEVFSMEYTKHDEKGNWIEAVYKNGARVTKTIEYY